MSGESRTAGVVGPEPVDGDAGLLSSGCNSSQHLSLAREDASTYVDDVRRQPLVVDITLAPDQVSRRNTRWRHTHRQSPG